MKLKAIKPLQYVCFFPTEFSTKQDGDLYVYLALDIYSQKLFNLGVFKDNQPLTVLKHIELLMNDKDFKLHRDKGFTLILHKYKSVEPQINTIIAPYKGKVIFNDAYIVDNMMPAIENIFKYISNKNKPK